MLSQPTSKRFLEAVQASLRTSVAPAVTERDAVVTLQSIDAILGEVIRRIDDENIWMVREIGEIEVAAEYLAGMDPASGAIRAALDQFRTGRSRGLHPREIQADYAAASALLGLCLERAVSLGGEAKSRLEAVLESRIETESIICGAFQVVGKD